MTLVALFAADAVLAATQEVIPASSIPDAASSLGDEPIVALLPLVNLSGAPAPLAEIRQVIGRALVSRGIRLVDDADVEAFMARHRMRHTGGVTQELGSAMRDETGATGAVVSSVDLYETGTVPKLALTVRFVSTDGQSAILWMQQVERVGNQAPGWFDRGLIREAPELLEKIVEELAQRLDDYLAPPDVELPPHEQPYARLTSPRDKRLRPRTMHRLPVNPAEFGRPLRVAVIPFANDSTRRNADQIMMLHFVSQLVGLPGVEIVEPGVVRQTLLRSRLILERGGLSFPQAEILRALLDVDLVFAGTVMTYQDLVGLGGRPEVDFTIRAIDTRTRQVVWTSISFNRGDEGVVFFDAGRYFTAHEMASEMARKTLAGMLWSESVERR